MAADKLLHKLHGSDGETLIETLVAILVAAMSVTLLFSCVTASAEINKNAQTTDGGYVDASGTYHEGYYDALTKAEKQDDTSPAASSLVQVTVSENDVGGVPAPAPPPVTVNVKLYGEKGIYSYKEAP